MSQTKIGVGMINATSIGDAKVLQGDGAWVTPSAAGWAFVSAATASTSSSIDFTGLEAGFDYELVIEHMIVGTDGVVDCRMGASGPAYRASGYLGFTASIHDDPGSISDVQTTGLAIGYTNDNTDGGQMRGIIRITDPVASTETNMQVTSQGKNATDFWNSIGGCYYNTAEAHVAVRIIPLSGNITSGEFYLYKRPNV